jgi:hypothetical protein
MHDCGILAVRAACNQASGDASLFKDQCDSRGEPALPVGGGPSQLAVVSGAKRLRSIEESFETEGAQYRFIPRNCTAHIHQENFNELGT